MGSIDSSKKNILRVSRVPPNCLIFGTSKFFAENMLPTYEDVNCDEILLVSTISVEETK